MKITLSEIRRMIRQELNNSRKLNESLSPHRQFVDDVINKFKNNKGLWLKVSNEFYDMAGGGDGDGIREDFYTDWKDEDFQEVIDALE